MTFSRGFEQVKSEKKMSLKGGRVRALEGIAKDSRKDTYEEKARQEAEDF